MSSTVGLWEHFKRLADFRGREDRASFWPYAALVLGIMTVGMFAIMIPEMFASMQAMQDFAAAHPDQTTVTSGPGHYSVQIEGNHPELAPNFGLIMGGMGIVTALTVGLYAAAVVRRLHDSGRSGYWALMPVPFLTYSMIQLTRFFGSMRQATTPDLGIFFSIFISNFIYIGTIVALIVMLAKRGHSAPNRFDSGAVLNG